MEEKKVDLDLVNEFQVEELEERLEMTQGGAQGYAEASGGWSIEGPGGKKDLDW